ncbi:hypothetical protein EDD18DRAFT_1420211 [Armillaria luteobubalina]|uniref:F-box domain-containing protein n=1 Tax=Armillaria luteobubalina TaxID=153913 RepID=A0AA39PPV1_9AGAR|nr:hypothetical protein EDD18DRAFT_1420211 [Armillaria luteobubalina]
MSSTSPISSSLPIELIEEILDYVNCLPVKDIQGILRHPSRGYNSGRVATLASCALVCRAWLPRSRFHLFVSVTLRLDNYASFLPLIASPFCSFLNSVFELVLSDEYKEGTIYTGTEDPEGDDYWIHKVLPNLDLSLFADIRYLTIYAARFDYMSEDGFTKTLKRLSRPTTITHLAIAYCVFWTQDHLIQALSSIKSLDAVNLSCTTLRIIPERDDKTQYPLPTLPASVSSLMINIDSAANVGWMAKIISVTDASLKRLNIKLWPRMVTWDSSMDEFYSALNFDCHPNLEIIAFDSLSLGTSKDGLDGRMKNRHIPVILHKITTSSIREVVLSLAPTPGNSMIKDPDDLDSLDLESMGEILRNKNYSKLKLISLLRIDCHLRPQVSKILSEGMRGLGRPLTGIVYHLSARERVGSFAWVLASGVSNSLPQRTIQAEDGLTNLPPTD